MVASEEKTLGRLASSERETEPEETAHDVRVARKHVFDFLERAQQQSMIQSVRFGTPAFDYNRLLTEFKYAEVEGAIPSTAALFDFLFERGVHPEMLQTLYDPLDVSLPYGHDLETYISRRFFGALQVDNARPSFKIDRKEGVYGGEELLKVLVAGKFTGDKPVKIDLKTAHEVQEIASEAAGKYGPESAAVTRLMFICSCQKGQPIDAAVQNIRHIVETQKSLSPSHESTQKNFFDKMRDFLGVYIDITRKVIRHEKPEQRLQIYQKAEHGLSSFLHADALHTTQGESLDPFEVFAQTIKNRDYNPWVLTDGKDTPFDVSRFHSLITKEVPRGLVADAAFFLNNYREALFIQEIHRLLNDIENYKERRRAVRRSSELSAELKGRMKHMVERIMALEDTKRPAPQDLPPQRRLLEDFASRQSRSISAFSVLLRALNPERVIRDDRSKQEFYTLISAMPRFSIERIRDDELREKQIQKIQIFGSSVQTFLENTDSYLDVPVLGREGNASIREILITRSERRWFDQRVLDEGPFAYSKDPDKPAPGQLIVPRDLLGKSKEDIKREKENFNSAAGAAWLAERKWLNDAGEAMARLLKSYRNVLRYARSEVDAHYHSGAERVTAFYPSVSDAMSDVVAGLFPHMGPEDYIIASTQEYSTVTKPFTKHGVRVIAVNCDQPVDKVIEDIGAIVRNERKDPVATVFSSKTRLGGAVGLVPVTERLRKTGRTIKVGMDKPNSHGLVQLFRGVEQMCPWTFTIMDPSQALGRNDLGEDLSRIPCDILVASGGKALGLKNVGLVSIRKSTRPIPEIPVTEDEQAIERYHEIVSLRKKWEDPLTSLTSGEGSVDTPRIAALGVALQMLNSRTDTSGIRKKPSGSPDLTPTERKTERRRVARDMDLTERERIAERMQEMTRHAKRRAEAYGRILLRNLEFPFRDELTDTIRNDPAVLEQFGCHVDEPAHDKVVDYFGLLTVSFPNLGGVSSRTGIKDNFLGRELDKLNSFSRHDTTLPGVGPGRDAWRVSILPARHEKRDIDLFFKKIEQIHIAFLKKQVESNREITNLVGLVQKTPNTRIEQSKEIEQNKEA